MIDLYKVFTRWSYRINPLKTLYFNFRKLPFSQAVRLPVLIAYNVILRNLDGKVIVNNFNNSGGGKIGKRIRIGFRDMGIQNEKDRKTILDLRKGSTVIFNGSASIGGGARLYTKGTLIIGDNFYLSLNSQIIAHECGEFGKDCTVGWGSLIMDTDFHKVIDVASGKQFAMTRPIIIGNHCWICNNVQILKGTQLPNDVIVGSCSLLNKVYEIPSHSLLAGNPAIVKKTGITHER